MPLAQMSVMVSVLVVGWSDIEISPSRGDRGAMFQAQRRVASTVPASERSRRSGDMTWIAITAAM